MVLDYPNAVHRLVQCLEHKSERIQVSSQLLNLSMLGHFSCFLSSSDFFLIIFFQKKYFRNTIRVSYSLDTMRGRQQVTHVAASKG